MKSNVKYPKVIIIGETFHKKSGGGITLSNLFSEWPKENLAVIATHKTILKSDPDLCNNLYQLGRDEIKSKIPLKFFQKKYNSGTYCLAKKQVLTHIPQKEFLIKIKTIINNLFNKCGLYFLLSKIEPSEKLYSWINDFNPEIIYTQLSTLELIRFVSRVIKEKKIPLAIHIMDDWPESIAKTSVINKLLFDKVIDYEFRNILKLSSINFSISDYMSAEYLKRYNATFLKFHNCIDINFWDSKSNIGHLENDTFTVLYAGRIGKGTSSSVLTLATAIDELNSEGFKIKFEIQTIDINNRLITLLKKKKSVKFVSRLPYSELPQKFSSVNLLTLPIDFDQSNKKFIKYSMPTKVPEYLSTKVPILVFAPDDTAVCSFFKENKLGYIVSNNDINIIKRVILNIYNNKQESLEYANKAYLYAKNNFSTEIVRKKFRNAISNAINRNT